VNDWSSTDLKDISGSAFLSVTPDASAFVNYQVFAAAKSICLISAALQKSFSLVLPYLSVGEHLLLCNISRSVIQPMVPLNHCHSVFMAVLRLIHPGIQATCCLLSAGFVWKEIFSDAVACVVTARNAVRQSRLQPAALVQPIPVPARQFSHIHSIWLVVFPLHHKTITVLYPNHY
jgi:hypothetical protein